VSKRVPYLLFVLLATVCFTFATILHPRTSGWSRHDDSGGILKVLLGDGRRLFANPFFLKADVAFHGGYYPSIFDQAGRPADTSHLKRKDDHDHSDHAGCATCAGHEDHEDHEEHAEGEDHHEDEHEKAMAFLGPPRDWIERFGRRFMITDHKHLEGGKEREMLPWLRISAELDPYKPDTYTVASFWLRDLGKTKEAEAFLREGVRNNPDSYEIYFEFGRLCFYDYKDVARARNLWELALHKWNKTQASLKEPDLLALDQIAVHLAHLEEGEQNYARAIEFLRLALKATPNPARLEEQITELQQKLGHTAATTAEPRPRE
jgi:hypothetical protein